MKGYKIRFNYKYLPYIWFSVPKCIYKFFSKRDYFVDTATNKDNKQ